MSHKISQILVTPEAYLAHERASSETKHEFVEGYLVAMAGGTISHGRMITTIARLLGNHLVGQSCDAFSSDVRLKVESNQLLLNHSGIPMSWFLASKTGDTMICAKKPPYWLKFCQKALR